LATKKQVNKAVGLGCYFSVGPAMLDSARAKKVISWLPQNRVLLETDGPFAKVGGRPVLPTDVELVMQYLSELWIKPISQVKSELRSNLNKLLG